MGWNLLFQNSTMLELGLLLTLTLVGYGMSVENIDSMSSNVLSSFNTDIKVLIVSEARSGSTLLTGLLPLNHPKAFVISEPWHDFPSESKTDLKGLDLANLFSCNFIDNPEVLAAVGWRGQGRHMIADNIKPFLTKVKETKFRYSHDTNYIQQYKEMISSKCLSSFLRVVKTIRLKQKYTNISTDLLNENLRVIHLIRNPVAIAKSYNKFTAAGLWKGGSEAKERISATCLRYQTTKKSLERQVPAHQHFRIRYEDIIAHPVDSMRRLYGFIGRSFGEEQEEAVMKYMATKRGPKCGDKCKVAQENQAETDPTQSQVPIDITTMSECKTIVEMGHYHQNHEIDH